MKNNGKIVIIIDSCGGYIGNVGGVPYMRNPPKPPPKKQDIGNNYQPTIDNTIQPPL